jgi:pyridoxal phosphate enzyme (YggS family)
MNIVQNFNRVFSNIQFISKKVTLIVVTKNQDIKKINSLISQNHKDFGENRVQEAIIKWKNVILKNHQLKLHFIGKLQSNKAKDAFEIFHYIHTLDNLKLAEIFSKLENNSLKRLKYFIQINVGNEPQKNGISINKLNDFVKYCRDNLNLNIIGLMCIPPADRDPTPFFVKLMELSKINNLSELSMGMSNDYECAIKNGATFIRIGSKIFEND